MEIVNVRNDITAITKNKENNLGSFKIFCIWLHKLHTIFDMTKEQIIKRKKSFNIHSIRRDIKITANLKYKELINLIKNFYFFSEYPNPFDLA